MRLPLSKIRQTEHKIKREDKADESSVPLKLRHSVHKVCGKTTWYFLWLVYKPLNKVYISTRDTVEKGPLWNLGSPPFEKFRREYNKIFPTLKTPTVDHENIGEARLRISCKFEQLKVGKEAM